MESADFKQDLFLTYAWDIVNGKGGGDFIYCLEEDCFYHYINGVWQKIHPVKLLSIVSNHIKLITKYPLVQRKQILDNLKLIQHLELEQFNKYPLINLENYMFDPIGINIAGHKKEFYSTVRIPYIYDKAQGCDLWLKTLDEILEGNKQKIDILQEFFGYCLTRETKQHKALLLLGESRSGKSTILHILRAMLGNDNCSSVPLKYISNPQYTAMLINKLVNIDTDVSAKATEFEAEFKTITSGEPLHVNQKYIPAFDFTPYCKIVMACNIFPKITDHSSAFYNRLILIPCDRVFSPEEQNRDLPMQLMAELPGILNWAINGLKKLVKRGRFEELDFMKNAVEELENENNPVNLFFEEHLLIGMGGFIEKGELFDKYVEWCVKTKNYNLSKARFASCVYKAFHKTTPKDTRLENGGKRIWKNVQYCQIKNNYIAPQEVSWQEPMPLAVGIIDNAQPSLSKPEDIIKPDEFAWGEP